MSVGEGGKGSSKLGSLNFKPPSRTAWSLCSLPTGSQSLGHGNWDVSAAQISDFFVRLHGCYTSLGLLSIDKNEEVECLHTWVGNSALRSRGLKSESNLKNKGTPKTNTILPVNYTSVKPGVKERETQGSLAEKIKVHPGRRW